MTTLPKTIAKNELHKRVWQSGWNGLSRREIQRRKRPQMS